MTRRHGTRGVTPLATLQSTYVRVWHCQRQRHPRVTNIERVFLLMIPTIVHVPKVAFINTKHTIQEKMDIAFYQ
jgi:hypothetical protein